MDILIITNGGVGDQIHFSSLIGGLKKKYKDSRITIFCHPNLNFVYYHDKNVYRITDKITDEEFDLGFNFALKNELLDIFDEINVKERVGFLKKKSKVAETEQAKLVQKKITGSNSLARKLMYLVTMKGTSKITISEWFCNIAEVEWEKPYFAYSKENLGEIYDDEIVVLQYGTNVKEKNWPKEYYKNLIKYFMPHSTVWITGHERYEDEIKYLNLSYKMLIGDYEDLNIVASLLSQSKLLISPDTSVAQIGMALGIKTIVLSNKFDRGFTLSDKFENLILIEEDNMEDIKPENVILECEKLR